MRVPRRLFLHVGCPKTGTSYLQSVLWHNQARLHEDGLLVPLSFQHHYALVNEVRTTDRFATNERLQRQAARLRKVAGAHEGDLVLTHELFAPARERQARALIESFAPAEAHVIITARDLARQLPAEWQQHVKSGRSTSLVEFVDQVRRRDPARSWFWSVQDVPDIARRWGASLPAEHVHVVTVPRPGTDPTLLWDRFSSVLGIPAGRCDLDVTRANESLGVVEVELLRLLNGTRRGGEPALSRRLATGVLGGRPAARRFGYDPAEHAWIVEVGTEMTERLRASDYDVVGDLDELLPAEQPERGVDPAAVTREELLGVAVNALIDATTQIMEAERDRAELRHRLERAERRLLAAEEALEAADDARQTAEAALSEVEAARAASLTARLRRGIRPGVRGGTGPA
jgi:hypothetical protein